MATTASSVASVAAASNSSASGGRPQLKSSMGGSAGSGNPRRATQSPIDGPQRRNSSHKAWQANQGQKYNGSSAPASAASPTPSQAAAMKTRTPSVTQGGETDTQDKHMHDRTVYLLAHLMSRKVVATVRSGAKYVGYLSGVETRSHDLGIALKWAKLHKAALGDEDKAKEGDFVGGGPEKCLVIEPKDLVEVHAEKIVLGDTDIPRASQQNGVATGFKTDADISGNLASRERELKRWHQPEESEGGLELEEHSAPGGGWNQFEANERLFGVTSDFDENIYTTKLNRDHPLYRQREATAAKIAAEIEGQGYNNAMNPHVAEERGLAVPDDSGMDEEDKYSGVQRAAPGSSSNNPNRYTPPALRAPSGQPTVPGAPHDPAIIASQLVRPETVQQKQPPPAIPLINAPKSAEEASVKPKDRPGLPELNGPSRNQAMPAGTAKPADQPQIEKEVSMTFKNFVSTEKERVKKKRADMVTRDRESKLRELKKFSESFTLKTEVPKDLVPILAKDKVKQEEIVSKGKQNLTKPSAGNIPMASGPPTAATSTATSSTMASATGGKVPPPGSFAAKNPEQFKREVAGLLSSLPPNFRPQTQPLAAHLRRVHNDRTATVRAPVPVPENGRAPFPPTGPSNSSIPPSTTTSAPSTGPKRLSVNAVSFKPNPNAASFTPTLGGPSTTATPSPTTSTGHAHPISRANSPSLFFGNKKTKPSQEKASLKDNFNPFKRAKAEKTEKTAAGESPPTFKTANDYIDRPWLTLPTWPSTEENKEKSYKQMFGLSDGIHSPQPPHMMPPQPHHQQLPPHMPHVPHGPHGPQQPHHGGPMQQHLGIPPAHYDQDPHMRQMSTPSSVMPSPSLHNATVAAPYQQSPVPHHIAMYPTGQQGMGQYGVPSAPGGPQYGFYNNGFRGTNGATGMMVHGSQPMPYPAPMGNQFMHPQMYSPNQHHAYMNGPPPPGSQGYPSPRPAAAPMMMHQNSSQGAPGGAQMVPYGMPGQGGPMYAQGQQPQMGMMRGQQLPPPPHPGGPPQFYHGPQQQPHYPQGNRGNAYVPQGQPGGPHGAPPPPVQQQMPPQQQPPQQVAAEGSEEAK